MPSFDERCSPVCRSARAERPELLENICFIPYHSHHPINVQKVHW